LVVAVRSWPMGRVSGETMGPMGKLGPLLGPAAFGSFIDLLAEGIGVGPLTPCLHPVPPMAKIKPSASTFTKIERFMVINKLVGNG
jgi:hypothetical protein